MFIHELLLSLICRPPSRGLHPADRGVPPPQQQQQQQRPPVHNDIRAHHHHEVNPHQQYISKRPRLSTLDGRPDLTQQLRIDTDVEPTVVKRVSHSRMCKACYCDNFTGSHGKGNIVCTR